MNRILLLLEKKKNRDLLAAWLEMRYEVVKPVDEPDLNTPFDLCLIDGPTLDRIWKQVQDQKVSAQPVFLPFVLITTRKDADMITRHLWKSIDEIILAPIEKVELQARVEILLRTRRLSLELKLRNEDLESFFHAMTHDLRAPLRVIAGFTEALSEEATSLNENSRHYLTVIQSATEHMQDLINALLSFARLGYDEVQLQEVDLQLISEKCLHTLLPDILTKNAQVTLQRELPRVRANPTLLKMALINLLSNALKFTAPGVQPRVCLSAQVQGGVCRIEIQDNGIGIAPEHQSHLFAPFVQLHGVEEYAGIGLGLATVQKAVEIMGGRVGLQSSLEQGSTFWIELNTVTGAYNAFSDY